jgi:predicted nucleic acid-binding Zn ribbon protein
MPTYTARCNECGIEQDYVRKIDDRDETPDCEHHQLKMERVLTSCMVPAMGIADHYQIRDSSGKTFYGKHEYVNYLKNNGLSHSSDIAGEPERQQKYIAEKVKTDRKKQIEKLVQQHIT